MASGSELAEYSSPVKRRRVDDNNCLKNHSTRSYSQNSEASRDNNNEDLEETFGVDSGFNEANDDSKSYSTPSITKGTLDSSYQSVLDNEEDHLTDAGDEKDEVSSIVSNLSDLSGLSDLEGDINHQWKSVSLWVQKQMLTGTDPRDLLHHLFMDSTQISQEVDDLTLWKIIVNMMSEPPRRQKLKHINTLTDVVRLIRHSKKIIVLTGAGVSVSCGIPDFRSRDGIYSRLAQDFPDLPDPQAMFDINYFSRDPRPFYKFAREIYPGQFKPSPCHRFIKMLDRQKKLLRNYSQNIDTLEQVAGIENVIECHGSFATASCTKCKYQVKADDIKEDIFAQRIPLCPKCRVNRVSSVNEINSQDDYYKDLVSQGIMKPDIVFFGEGLPDSFHYAMAKDKDDCDLLIVIGSSLKVRPVALIPSSIPPHVPQILINRESLPHLKFDVELLGDSDIIINQLCHLIGENYQEICWQNTMLKEVSQLLPARYLSEDICEQSRDDTTNAEFSQDSTEINLRSNNTSTESQDSIMMNSNRECIGNTDICISPFHAGHMENTDGSFSLLGESPKRRLGDSSAENSPKRMNFGHDCNVDFVCTKKHCNSYYDNNESKRITTNSSETKNSVVSIESSSDDTGAVFNLEECHVIPKISSFSARDSISMETNQTELKAANVQKLDNHSSVPPPDKLIFKPRQASVDSAMDSGIGDSCNSVDSTEARSESENLPNLNMKSNFWHSRTRESLVKRLPDDSYYQLTLGKYIFPGAEVFSDLEDFDQRSISVNSESSDTDTDTSTGDEDEDDEIDDEEGENKDESKNESQKSDDGEGTSHENKEKDEESEIRNE